MPILDEFLLKGKSVALARCVTVLFYRHEPGLQIRRGKRDNLGTIFVITPIESML